MTRRIVPFTAALTTLVIFLVLSSVLLPKPEPNIDGTPPDFYHISKEVSLTKLVEVATKSNISLYLPTTIPSDLKLTTIYLRETNFLAMVVYSSNDNRDYKTAELTIFIAPVTTPTYNQLKSEESESKTTQKINDWLLVINEQAYVGEDEHSEKFGDTHLVARAYFNNLRYTLNAPTLTKTEVIQLVESMSLQALH